VTDADALSRAHADAVRNRSYEWRVVYRRGVGGENPVIGGGPSERSRQVARVENGTESLIRVTGDDGANEPTEFGPNRDVYADGTARYVRRHHENGTTTVRRTPLDATDGPSGVAAQAADRLRGWLLTARATDVVESEQRGNVTRYRLVGRGSDSFTNSEFRPEAWITADGFVTDLEVAHTAYGGRGTTFIEFTYRRVGTATVDRPAWATVDRTDGNATANGTVTGTPTPTTATAG
jgi:hypothetical protein